MYGYRSNRSWVAGINREPSQSVVLEEESEQICVTLFIPSFLHRSSIGLIHRKFSCFGKGSVNRILPWSYDSVGGREGLEWDFWLGNHSKGQPCHTHTHSLVERPCKVGDQKYGYQHSLNQLAPGLLACLAFRGVAKPLNRRFPSYIPSPTFRNRILKPQH